MVQKIYEGLVGVAVTISLTISLLVGRNVAGLRGMATGFVASVGIIGALWGAANPEPSPVVVRIIFLIMAALCAVGVFCGGWHSGWVYGLIGYLAGWAMFFVFSRVKGFSS